MGVLVEGSAEVVDEGDGTDLGGRAGPGALLLEGLFDHAQHKAQCGAADRRVALLARSRREVTSAAFEQGFAGRNRISSRSGSCTVYKTVTPI